MGLIEKKLELQKRAINESIDNITNEEKVFSVKINNKTFKIDRYTNLVYFGNLLFKGTINLKSIGDQRKLSEIVNELKKKINTRRGRPLSEENKDDIKNLIKNGREILTIRADIIKAYRKSINEIMPNLIDFDEDEDDDDG